jgi:flagellar motor switch protein FliM
MTPTAPLRRSMVRDDAKPFDFRRPTALSREHVRTMQIAQEAMARGFTTALAGSLRAVTQVSIRDIDQCTYDEYVRSVPNPTLLTLLSLNSRRVSAMLEIPLRIAYTATELLLGGTASPVQPRRAMTDLELDLMHDVVDGLLPEVKEALAPIMPQVDPAIVGQESNPQFAQLAAPSDMVLLVTFEVKLETTTDTIRLSIPFSNLQGYLEAVGPASPVANSAMVAEERARVQSHVETAPVVASVRFRPALASAKQLAHLAVGDVLVFEHPSSMPLTLEVDGVEIVDVGIGRVGRTLGVQVHDQVPEGRRRRQSRLSVISD